MKKLLLIMAILFSSHSFASLFSSFSSEEWGRTGHRVTGEIAEQYLIKRAKREVAKILDGKSLALVSTYGDDIKSDPRYREFGPWHYVNIAEDQTTYSEEEANPEGDLVLAIRKCIEILKDKNASKEDKEFYLKMLVHFMGDLHQPFHAGRGEDRGGNDIRVTWFRDNSNIHRVWDSEMINDFQMSYTELAENADPLKKWQVNAIKTGSVLDWMYESKSLSEKVYNSVENGEDLGYRYMYDWFPVVREQLQKGGIRLAKILNEVLG